MLADMCTEALTFSLPYALIDGARALVLTKCLRGQGSTTQRLLYNFVSWVATLDSALITTLIVRHEQHDP